MKKKLNSFPKHNRIRKSRDFKKVGQGAKRKENKFFTLLYKPGRTRLGITVSTKVGNSPQRNYLKRSVREFFRTHKFLFNTFDVVLIAKPAMADLTSNQVADELVKLINSQR